MSTCHESECCKPSVFGDLVSTPSQDTTTTYWNTEQSYTASCPTGYSGSSVTKTIAADTYSSTSSQSAADALALAAATAAANSELMCSADEEGGCDNVVVPLTEDDGSVTASSKSSYAWYVFDGDTSSFAWAPNEDTTHWIQIDLGAPTEVLSYRIYASPSGPENNGDPKAWVMEGSNNGVDYDTLDTRSGVTDWTSRSNTYSIQSPGTYQYYRWTISETRSTGVESFPYDVPILAEIELYPCANHFYYETDDVITIPTGCFWTSCYAAADPYPSSIVVPNSGTISEVRVTLRDIQVSSSGDSWVIVLESPSGTFVVLWGAYGSSTYWGEPITITFRDGEDEMPTAPTYLYSGTYKTRWPADTQPPFDIPDPEAGADYGYLLSDFVGEEMQGTWNLWIGSRVGVETTIDGGWELNITTS